MALVVVTTPVAPPPAPGTSSRLVPVLVGAGGAVNAAAVALPGSARFVVPGLLAAVAWTTLAVCFLVARRRPVARDVGVAAAVTLLVTLAWVPVSAIITAWRLQ